MSALTLQDLLEAGAHFGHQTKRWNPKMQRFILCPRNGIYIVDLNKTLRDWMILFNAVKNEVQKGGKVLFRRHQKTDQRLHHGRSGPLQHALCYRDDGSAECSQISRRSARVFPNLKK